MNFTYQYRKDDGSVGDGELEAASREAAFAALAARGVHPMRVAAVEGGRSAPARRAGAPRAERMAPVGGRRRAVWVVLAVVGVAAGLAVGRFLAGGSDGPGARTKPVRKNGRIADVAGKESASRPVKSADKPAAKPAEPVAKAADVFRGVEVVSRQATTNANGVVIERISTADGKTHRVTRPPRPVFEYASDQLIAMAIAGANNGGPMPPMPLSSSTEEDFRKSLEKPIEVLENDSEEVKALKREVMAVRERIKDLVAGGMTVREALAAHEEEVNRNAEFRAEALKGLNEMMREGGREDAKAYVEKVNAMLEERGAVPIEVPRSAQ